MLQADLADAGIQYIDSAGRYFDFHGFRHTTASMLAAGQVHPKVAQQIMRHSTVDLTLSRYSHVYQGQTSEAIENLPDLNLPSEQQQAKTGTDARDVLPTETDSKKLGAFLGAFGEKT